MRKPIRAAAVALLPLFVAGCVGVQQNSDTKSGFALVSDKTGLTLGKQTVWVQNRSDAASVKSQVRQLLATKYVDADAAVQVALLNNKSLQAEYAEIGMSVADLWQESLPTNPTLAVSYMGIGGLRTLEGVIASNIIRLLTRDRRLGLAEIRLLQARLRAFEATLAIATETRVAWIEAVAAWETVANLNQAKIAADAAAELAAELGRTGAFPKVEQAREQAFYAELTAQTSEARLEAQLAKEELVRLMGIWGQDLSFEVPNALPGMPSKPGVKSKIEAEALRNRVDLQVARLQLDALAKSYGLTAATRYVSDLELAAGPEVEQEVEETEDGGEKRSNELTAIVEVSLEIPIFDSGQARLRKAEFAYLQAANIFAAKSVDIRSEARSAYKAYRSRYDIARHYSSNIVPLRTTIEKEALLTYNGMITSTFELLADTRAKLNAILLSLNAKRAFYLADAGLTAAIYGGGEVDSESGAEAAAAGGDDD
mgnify:CR=1 FL=1|jgi:outer membrane protein TolC|tara:strand:- start:571 stop:2022 length:1452 start_codon:yes stop_codon:yes gene_type:complete